MRRQSVRRPIIVLFRALWAACIVMLLYGGKVIANPTGGTVVAGSATMAAQGSTLNVNTQTDRAVINWQGFSIGAGETTNFVQPSASSAVLNRVVTPGLPSNINGALNSNGNVFLINPSGVVVGPSGVVTTNGFIASTLDVDNQQFMRGGDLDFRGDSNAAVINRGKILTGAGGAHLIANQVINEGLIESDGGNVSLAAGGVFKLRGGGTYIQADVATIANGISEFAPLIRNSGTVRATGAAKIGGEVYLVSPAGRVLQEAIVQAKKQTDEGRIDGGKVAVDAGEAVVSGTIDVDGEGTGDGGEVILWANHETDFTGTILARGGTDGGQGGFAEVSGRETLLFNGHVDTGGGTLLLDPFNYTIGGPQAANIVGALGLNNVIIQTTADVPAFGSSGIGTDPGDITVNSPVLWSSPFSLTMLAHRDVRFNASVQNGDATGGDLNIVAGWDGTTAFNAATFLAEDVSTTTLFGNGMGSIFVGDGTQTAGIAVGSRNGGTNVFAYDLALGGSTTTNVGFAQLGFQVSNAGAAFVVTGPINARMRNDITAGGGTRPLTYAQVGHVGADSDFSGTTDATVTAATISVAVRGNLTFTAGGGSDSYAHLGHGGRFAFGDHGGDITITEAADLTFTGGTNFDAYAQLGHGGDFAVGDHSGHITITEANDLTFTAGSGGSAYAQLGHGGIIADGNHSGDITIGQAGDLTFTGTGSGGVSPSTRAYSQLGHGGWNANGNLSGDILITKANDFTFRAGSTENTYAQLGHGGSDADGRHTGSITVGTLNALTFDAGSGINAYAQLGHGGIGADGNDSGDITIGNVGDLTFQGGLASHAYAMLGHGGSFATGSHGGTIAIDTAGDLLFTSGTGFRSYTQLGHGGIGADGNDSGDITISDAANITFTGGNGAYAQLGHGGLAADGNHSGVITIQEAGDLTFTGGGGSDAYAQLGHGAPNFLSSGTRLGHIDVRVTGETSLINGTGTDAPWMIGHRTTTVDGVSNANVTLITGTLDYSDTTTSTLATLNQDFAGKMGANLAGGHVTIGATNGTMGLTGGMSVGGAFLYDQPHNLSLLSTTDLRFNAGVQNEHGTSGDVNLVAGWDGTSGIASPFDPTSFLTADVDTTTLYGNNDGSILIGDGTQTTGIAVGSRSGGTNAFGYDLMLTGSTVADSAFAQLGFQVTDAGAAFDVTGPIDVRVTHDITADGGSRLYAYTQVGHVGADRGPDTMIDSAVDAAIGVEAGGNLMFTSGSGSTTYAQLGHGGYFVYGNHNGVITITNANELAFNAGISSTTYAQLGHGGVGAVGNHSGDITITEAGDITFAAATSSGFQAYAQLGHGGQAAFGNHSGNITITEAHHLTFSGGNNTYAYGQLGHGGANASGNHSGNITITEAGNLVFTGGGGFGAYAQLGHGGFGASGNHSGAITIGQAGDLTFSGGGSDAYAQLGHGGFDADGSHSGAITIHEAGDLAFSGGSGAEAYAQLGHGGRLAFGNHSGAISIGQAGNLTFTGGTLNTSGDAYVQLGHGGINADGNHSGNITVSADGNLAFVGGSGVSTYAQLGHGGVETEGDHSGDITITTANDLTFTGGIRSIAYAQLGHGGNDAQGNHSGAITINEAGDLTFTSGLGVRTYAQLGHGGASTDGNHSGAITISTAHDFTFLAGPEGFSHVQLGHGGNNANGNHSGQIVIGEANNLSFTAGSGSADYAQLGHGGANANGSRSGDITIGQANSLVLLAGTGSGAYAQLGNGGVEADGIHGGAIVVNTLGSLTLTGQDTTNRYAVIGHGDEPGDGDAGHQVAGDVTLNVGTSATLTNAFIGHLIDANGTYASGNTYIAIGTQNYSGANITDALVSDANSRINSALPATGGELRFYLPRRSSFQMADGALINGVDVNTFNDTTPFPNEQGGFAPFAGPYVVNLADGNYAFYFGVIELVVRALDGMSVYGDVPVDPGMQLVSGTLNSGDSLTSIGLTTDFAVTQTTPVGVYVINVLDDSLDPVYELVEAIPGMFQVKPAALSIIADDQMKTYGDSFVFNGTEFTAVGLKNLETVGAVTLTSAATPPTASVGFYPINVSSATGGTFDPGNYTITYVPGEFQVKPAALSIIADDQMKTYGDAFVFNGTEFTAVGLKNLETVGAVTLTSAATPPTAGVGFYPIDVSDATGGTFDPSNYTIAYVPGTFQVKPAALTITALDQMKTYGDSFVFDGTEFTAVGLKNLETVGTVTLTSAATPPTAGVGFYPIDVSDATGGAFDPGNYTIAYVPGTFQVKPALLFVKALDQMKTYGDRFQFDGDEFRAFGLRNGETVARAMLTSAATPPTADAGDYVIHISHARGGTFDPNNYAIRYVPGEFIVKPAPLSILANDQIKLWGLPFAFDGTEFEAFGLKNGEVIETVELTSPGAPYGALPGLYAIDATNPVGNRFSASNYAIRFIPGEMTVFTVPANYIHDTFDRYRLWAETLPSLLRYGVHVGVIRHVAGDAAFPPRMAGLNSFDLFDPERRWRLNSEGVESVPAGQPLPVSPVPDEDAPELEPVAPAEGPLAAHIR